MREIDDIYLDDSDDSNLADFEELKNEEEEESDDEMEKKCYIIYPDEPLYNVIEITITLALLLSSFITPLDLAFPELRDSFFGLNVTIYIIDIFFSIQIVLNFFIATEDDFNAVNEDLKLICKNYLKGWFLVDFFSVFPFDMVLQDLLDSSNTGG